MHASMHACTHTFSRLKAYKRNSVISSSWSVVLSVRMADVSAAQSTFSKRLKLSGKFSKSRKQEREFQKYFDDYGNVSDLEICESNTATLTLTVTDEKG